VTNIGNVADITDFITQMPEVAKNQVECDGRPGMSEMGITINGRPAYIHSNMWWIDRLKKFFSAT